MKNKSLFKSFYHAFNGIFVCLEKERNMKIHVLMMMLVIVFGFVFQISTSEWMTCLILFSLVIGAECMNTAIEETVDICSPEISEKARLSKDAAAGSVLVFAIIAAINGLIIFLPKVLDLF